MVWGAIGLVLEIAEDSWIRTTVVSLGSVVG